MLASASSLWLQGIYNSAGKLYIVISTPHCSDAQDYESTALCKRCPQMNS